MGDTLEAMMRAEDEEEEDDGHEKIFFFFFLFFGLCCESRRQVMLRPQRFAGDRVRSSGFARKRGTRQGDVVGERLLQIKQQHQSP